MGTYTQLLYQIVYSTKYRKETLLPLGRDQVFKYIWGVLRKQKCHPYQIGGVSDHLHIVSHVHPTIAISDLVKDIKLSCTDMIKAQELFPVFGGWQDGFAAFTYSIDAKDTLVKYVLTRRSIMKKLLLLMS